MKLSEVVGVVGLSMLLGMAGADEPGSLGCGKLPPLGIIPGVSANLSFLTTDPNHPLRSYIIHLPSKYNINKPAPVIFSFHGLTRTAASQEALSQFDNEDWNPDAIAIYPQGLNVRAAALFLIFAFMLTTCLICVLE